MSQYSIPYFAGRVKMFLAPAPDHQGDLTTTLTVQLKDGRTVSRRATHFKGTPDEPLTVEELRTEFLLVTQRFGAAKMSQVFDRIQNLEAEASLDWLGG